MQFAIGCFIIGLALIFFMSLMGIHLPSIGILNIFLPFILGFACLLIYVLIDMKSEDRKWKGTNWGNNSTNNNFNDSGSTPTQKSLSINGANSEHPKTRRESIDEAFAKGRQ